MNQRANGTLQDHDQATNWTVESLRASADAHVASDELDAALALLFKAYSLEPGDALLQSIAGVYSAMGDTESATLCGNGVVPPAAESRFLRSVANPVSLINAGCASDNRHLKGHDADKVRLPTQAGNVTQFIHSKIRFKQNIYSRQLASKLSEVWQKFIGSASTKASTQDSLPATLIRLKHTIAEEKDPGIAFLACLTANDSNCRAYAIYREIGEIAISTEQWELAEEFAVRSLKALPRYGAAFKLLGLSLRGQERYDEAAMCHRYNLPYAIRDKYFKDSPIQSVHSLQAGDTVTRHPAFDAEEIELTPPIQLHPVFIDELSATKLHVREARTYRLSSCRVWFDSFNTVIWDREGRIIEDACRGFFEVVQSAATKQEAVQLEGLTCVLGNRNSDNYYHWMNDLLPRLAVLQKSGIDLNSIDHFITSKLKHAFQFETLAAFGIHESRLTYIGKNIYFSCDECVVPVYGSNTLGLGQGAWNPAFLKNSLLLNPSKQADKKLYISRADSNSRSIDNETALISYLSSVGFHTVCLESMSVQAQAELFNSASVILSPHGAGLSNIAFCNPGTTIIELYKDHIAPCFWTISQVMGLRHCVHYCGDNSAGTKAANSEAYHITADHRRKSNFSVNVDDVASLFDYLQIDCSPLTNATSQDQL